MSLVAEGPGAAGFTNDRGGAIASWRGSLAVLVRPRFQENYAAFGLSSNTNSHDAAVGVSRSSECRNYSPHRGGGRVEGEVLAGGMEG